MSARRVLRTGGLWFNGKDSYVSLNIPPIYKSVTSMGWAAISKSSQDDSFLWRVHHGFYGSFGVEVYGGALRGIIRTSSGYSFTTPYYVFNEMEWIHVAHRFNRDTRVHELLINGEVVASRTHPYNEDLPGFTTFHVGLGGTYPDWRYLRGIIDEVRVYNRFLSTDEIKAIYERDEPIKDGLVLYLDFSEYEGNIVYDKSGNNNNGTIYGGARWVVKKALRVLPKAR